MWTQDAHKAAFGERAGKPRPYKRRRHEQHGSEDPPLQRRSRSGMSRGAVVEVDNAVGEGFGGEEFETDGAVARLNQGDAFADEDGKRRREQQRFCAAPTVLPIVASIFTQPLRAGLTYGAPTALLGSENSNPAEPRQIRQNRGKSGRTAAESAVLDAHAALWAVFDNSPCRFPS